MVVSRVLPSSQKILAIDEVMTTFVEKDDTKTSYDRQPLSKELSLISTSA